MGVLGDALDSAAVEGYNPMDKQEKYRQSLNQAKAQQGAYAADQCTTSAEACCESTQERIIRNYRDEAERATRVAMRSQQAATFLANNPAFAEFLALKNEGVL